MEKLKLEETIIILPKSKIKAGDGKKEGKYPLYRSSNNLDTYYDEYLLDEEVIIIGTGGNPSIHYNKGKCAYTTQCLVLKSKGELENKYIYYYLLSRLNKIKRMFRGLAIKQLDKKTFFKLDILLVDKVKQKRIIENLDKISNNIQSKKEQLKNLEKLVKSQFVEMFGDLKYSIKLGKCCTINARIGWQSLTKKEHMKTGEYMLITGTDFKDNEIDYSNCVYVSKERYEMDKKIILDNDDILITKDGTIGKVAVVKNLEKPATLNSGIFVVRPNNIFNKEYIMYVFKGHIFKEFVNKAKTGATIKHLNQKKLINFEIPKPSMEEQIEFSNIYKQIDKQKFEIEKSLKETQKLYESLMNEYFKGDMR